MNKFFPHLGEFNKPARNIICSDYLRFLVCFGFEYKVSNDLLEELKTKYLLGTYFSSFSNENHQIQRMIDESLTKNN
jgi:hypothetical protein